LSNSAAAFAQPFVNFSKLQRPGRTGRNARRRGTCLGPLYAHVAFDHRRPVARKFDCAEWAHSHAKLATDAALLIQQHRPPVRYAADRPSGTNGNARRIVAVAALKRHPELANRLNVDTRLWRRVAGHRLRQRAGFAVRHRTLNHALLAGKAASSVYHDNFSHA
jgi:hypothetical protein